MTKRDVYNTLVSRLATAVIASTDADTGISSVQLTIEAIDSDEWRALALAELRQRQTKLLKSLSLDELAMLANHQADIKDALHDAIVSLYDDESHNNY